MGIEFGLKNIPRKTKKHRHQQEDCGRGVRKISCSMTPRALSDTAAPRRLTVVGYIVRDKIYIYKSGVMENCSCTVDDE